MKRSLFSWPASEETPDDFAKARELPRKTPAQQKPVAVVVQTEAARKPKSPVRWQIPCDHGREVVRCIVQTGTLRVAQTSVHFHPGNKILPAKITALG